MKKKDHFIALIPARKGSKGVKNKNIVKINNKYLIEYTLKHALKSKIIDEIYVSSNDKRIKKITEKFKKVNFLFRKNSLSNSKTLLKKVILDFLNFINNDYDLKKINLVLLQPTSPQRKAKDIDEAIKLFKKKRKFPLISASEPISNPNDIIYLNKKKYFLLIKHLIIKIDKISKVTSILMVAFILQMLKIILRNLIFLQKIQLFSKWIKNTR